MKTLLLVLAAVGLSGCAVYPAGPAYGPYGAVEEPAYVTAPPVYIYGSGTYGYGGHPAYPRGYNRGYPGAVPYYPQRPYYGSRDQDRDGVPNRYDRDRDGDGVPNRFDRRPGNPNWR